MKPRLGTRQDERPQSHGGFEDRHGAVFGPGSWSRVVDGVEAQALRRGASGSNPSEVGQFHPGL